MKEQEKKVEVNLKDLKQLVENFYIMCDLADEVDIYEFQEGCQAMDEMKEWVGGKFEKYR